MYLELPRRLCIYEAHRIRVSWRFLRVRVVVNLPGKDLLPCSRPGFPDSGGAATYAGALISAGRNGRKGGFRVKRETVGDNTGNIPSLVPCRLWLAGISMSPSN